MPATEPDRVLGVAIGVPEPYGSELRMWRKRFGDPAADDIPPHVTLLPPTRLRASVLPAVEAHLRVVAGDAQPFDVFLRGTATFRPVSPVVFLPLAQGISHCERLERQVRSGPLARATRFNYHPHVTVGHDLPDTALDRAYDELSAYVARFRVESFTLFEQDAGGTWRPQREFRFGQPSAEAGTSSAGSAAGG